MLCFWSSFAAGKSLAIKYGCKYIETSPGINHNVDELLVGMLAQIQLKRQREDDRAKSSAMANAANSSSSAAASPSGKKNGLHRDRAPSSSFKVLDMLLEKVWRFGDSKSKSCGNLHVL